MTAPPLLLVVGGPRTGTHLLNALLCTSPGVLPLLSESAPVYEIVQSYRRTLAHVQMYPGIYFGAEAEVTALYARSVQGISEHLLRRYDSETCVFRSPALTPFVNDLRRLVTEARYAPHFLCMVRDPRDVVVSMDVWSRREVRGRGRPVIADAENPVALSKWYASYYRTLWREPTPDVLFVRYEDLVASPQSTATAINEFAGLATDADVLSEGWAPTVVRLAPDERHVGAAITPLYNQPPSTVSVGRWRDALEPEMATQVLRESAEIVRRFYPRSTDRTAGVAAPQ